MIKVVVDTGGSDNGPLALIEGSLVALEKNKDLSLVLVGDESLIQEAMQKANSDFSRVEIISATDVVTNHDNPMRVLREHPESTLAKALNYLKNHEEAAGLVNCGSTGALLCTSIFTVGRIGKCRPALATVLPTTEKTYACLVDCGANSDCTSDNLVEFAYMGKCYQEAMYGMKNPRIAILSNGTEDKKGNALTKEAFLKLKEHSDLKFIGNVEGSNALAGSCDVLVCDGFTGNIFLKNTEGTAKMLIKDMVKMAKKSDEDTAKIIMNTVGKLMAQYDFNSLGGAILLGVNKVIVKGHGAASSQTMIHTINLVYELSKNELISKMKEALE